MKLNEKYLSLLVLLVLIIGYHYYNYANRRNALDLVEEFKSKNELTQIWHNREIHDNIFDFLLGEENEFNFLFVQKRTVSYTDRKKYKIEAVAWQYPTDLNSFRRLVISRDYDRYIIASFREDYSFVGMDTLTKHQIERTWCEVVDGWVRDNY
jgi:hypothetical protein